MLTCIGSILMFWYYWREYATSVETEKQMKELFKGMWALAASDFVKYVRQHIAHALVQMTCCALCFAGVAFIWRLRKWGFWIYVIGQLGSLAAGIWLATALMEGPGPVRNLLLVLISLLQLGFMTMYALNYKRLR